MAPMIGYEAQLASKEMRLPTLQNIDRADKRSTILDQAVSLFNDQGYFDTRLEDVAARMGTAKTSISYHFKSKEALLFEAYSATCDFAEGEIALAAQAPDGLSRICRWIRAFTQAQSAAVLGHRGPIAVISDPSALGEGDGPVITGRLSAHAGAIETFLREGRADGSVRVRSTKAATFFLLSVQQWVRRWLLQVDPRSHDAAIDGLIDVIRHGIAADRTMSLFSASPDSTVDAEHFIFDREARNRMKLEAFLRIGTRYLNRRGYRTLSVHDLSTELGASRGVFYYHFEDKEDLLRRCVARSLDLMDTALARYRTHQDISVRRLHFVLTILFDGHFTDLNPLIRQSLFASLGPKDRPIALARAKRVTAGFAELIAEGASDGSIRPIDLDAIEHLVCGSLFGATRQRHHVFGLDDSGTNDTADAAAYFEPLFFGLAAR